MARLVKNIDTLRYGSLQAGRLLNGLMDESKIAELIASGHAIVTEGDRSIAFNEKEAESGSGAPDFAFEHGYAAAFDDETEAESGDAAGTDDSNANTGADKKNKKTIPKSKGH
ncbi:MAG: hypothetical protein EKE20_16420 [Candidatus Symbiopectobacterium sp. Dall1.0]|nr:hypothetical protein [Candidatus Symbiopectobacterium sp. Dall1.0]